MQNIALIITRLCSHVFAVDFCVEYGKIIFQFLSFNCDIRHDYCTADCWEQFSFHISSTSTSFTVSCRKIFRVCLADVWCMRENWKVWSNFWFDKTPIFIPPDVVVVRISLLLACLCVTLMTVSNEKWKFQFFN